MLIVPVNPCSGSSDRTTNFDQPITATKSLDPLLLELEYFQVNFLFVYHDKGQDYIMPNVRK